MSNHNFTHVIILTENGLYSMWNYVSEGFEGIADYEYDAQFSFHTSAIVGDGEPDHQLLDICSKRNISRAFV